MKHLQVTFTDGTVEDVNSNYDKCRSGEGELRVYSARSYGADEVGPTYVLANVRKYEWVK